MMREKIGFNLLIFIVIIAISLIMVGKVCYGKGYVLEVTEEKEALIKGYLLECKITISTDNIESVRYTNGLGDWNLYIKYTNVGENDFLLGDSEGAKLRELIRTEGLRGGKVALYLICSGRILLLLSLGLYLAKRLLKSYNVGMVK